MIPEHLHRQLTRLHLLRANVDREIRRLEADLRAQQRLKADGARQRRKQWIEHGTNAGYQWHVRRTLPFPEDEGGEECGCRDAHAAYVAAATRRRKAGRALKVSA